MESVCPEIVTSLLASGRSYKDISQELKSLYPQVQRGLSERSVRRYVKENNLKVQAEQHVLETVKESVGEVSQARVFQIKHTIDLLLHVAQKCHTACWYM